MRLLLDTHVVLWSLFEPGALSSEAQSAILRAESLHLSVVSPWEMVIKSALGKLEMRRGVPEVCRELEREFGAQVLPVTLPHVLEVARLPPHHGDPFDRLLIAQARVEGLTLVTRDRAFADYDLLLIPA